MTTGYVSADVKSTSVRERLERERFIREEQEAQDRKLKPLLDEQQNLLRQVDAGQRDLVRQFYSRSIEVIRDEVKAKHPLSIDEGFSVATGPCSLDQWHKSGNEWLDSLTARTGITLSVNATARVFAYCAAQALAGKNMSTIAAWDAAYNRLFDSGAFGVDEIGFDESLRTQAVPAPVPEPTPAPTMQDLMNVDCGTMDGQRQARQIADSLYERECGPLALEWVDSLRNNFGFVPTREQLDATRVWFERNNRSWLDRRSFDACRLAMISQGIFPETCWTDQDRANLAIESLERPIGMSDYEYRKRCQQLARGR
jgi:hypothetical protein